MEKSVFFNNYNRLYFRVFLFDLFVVVVGFFIGLFLLLLFFKDLEEHISGSLHTTQTVSIQE